jgi:DNA-binding beta-propeller fold protein YncE
MTDDPRDLADLRRFWNELARDGVDDADRDVPSEHVETVRRLRARGMPRVPVTERERSWRELRARIVADARDRDDRRGGEPNSPAARIDRARSNGSSPNGWSAIAATRHPAARAASWLSLAAIVLVALLGIVVLAQADRPDERSIGVGIPLATNRGCAGEATPDAGSSPVAVGEVDGARIAVDLVWESQGASDGFTPAGMAVDAECRVWVANQELDRIEEFAPDGTMLDRSLNGVGVSDGQFNFVTSPIDDSRGAGGIAFAPDGSRYVLDVGNHRVQEFDAKGAFVRAWGTAGAGDGQFRLPVAILIDRAGDVEVLDRGRGDVQVFSSTGVHLRSFGGGALSAPAAFALAPNGDVWVADQTGLRAFDPDGTAAGAIRLPELANLNGLAIDLAGNFYIANGRVVTVYDQHGAVLVSWTTPEIANVASSNTSLAIDDAGNVYVGDFAGQRLWAFALRPAG